ncbi:MAG: rRNA maturation RNAse YbeY [Minisyncoccia bacterium]
MPFESIKNAVLGKDYELSLVFCGSRLSRRLNKTYRGKDKQTNVLSFPLSENSGEIFINLSHLNGFSVGNLFIHGLFHLKGFDHGDTMEQAESILRKKFKI